MCCSSLILLIHSSSIYFVCLSLNCREMTSVGKWFDNVKILNWKGYMEMYFKKLNALKEWVFQICIHTTCFLLFQTWRHLPRVCLCLCFTHLPHAVQAMWPAVLSRLLLAFQHSNSEALRVGLSFAGVTAQEVTWEVFTIFWKHSTKYNKFSPLLYPFGTIWGSIWLKMFYQ